MSESSALVAAPRSPAPRIDTLQEVLTLGEVLAKSGFFADARSAAQAVVKVLAGRELGFQAVASMVGIHIIEGKPSVGAHLMAAMIRRSGRYDYRIVRCDREACELEFTEKREAGWQTVGRTTLTMQEAVSSGLALAKDGKALKANWARSADDMLFARCITKGFRRYCPDLTGGVSVYDPDELDAAPAAPAAIPHVNGQIIAGYVLPDGTRVGMDETTPPPGGPDPNSPAPADEGYQGLPPAITDDQHNTLVELCRQRGRPPSNVSLVAGLCGAKALDRLPAGQYERAYRMLSEGLATTDQVDRITRAVNGRKLPWEHLSARLEARYGVKSLAHLTEGQAAEVEAAFTRTPA